MINAGIYAGIIVLLIALVVLTFRLSMFLAKRAICKVIATFRDYGAVEYGKALRLESLGLSPKPFFLSEFYGIISPGLCKL